MSKSWYSIKAMSEGDETSVDVHIYDEIGFWGITARDFVAELKASAVGATQINLHINSPGGSVVDGVAIQNAIKQHPANVTTYIDGIAASIASIIALGGDDIQIADNAYVMIHNPASIVWGEAKDMIKEAEVLDKMADGLAGDYAAKMGIEPEEARALMDEETWYLGQEAVDAGFADTTYSGTQAVASFNAKRFSAKAPEAAVKRFTKSPPSGKPKPSAKKGETVKNENDPPEDEDTPDIDGPEGNTSEPESPETPEEPSEPVNVEEAVAKALAKERKRTAEVTALGGKFGFADDAEKHIASGGSVEDFRAHILNKSPEDWKASLAVRNPSVQDEDDSDDDAGKAVVAAVKERRKARNGG